MSREGSQHRIDSLKSTLGTNQYQRTALGNAVRFHTMINVLNEGIDGRAFADRDEFLPQMENSVRELERDWNNELGIDSDSDNRTVQQARHNRAFNSRLGATIADETVMNASKFAEVNSSPFRFGTSNAFNRFTGEILSGGGFGGGDDEDFFGSRALYDNVFAPYENLEDGTSALSTQLANTNPDDMAATAAARVLKDNVNRSLYDSQNIVDRLDVEFQRFHGESMINQLSMTGSGLSSARRTIRNTLVNGTVGERNRLANSADIHASALQQKTDPKDLVSALELINNNLGNRSSAATQGGYVDKAGIANFVDLVNTAENKISIQSFQFQNEAISAALIDKIQRRVLENVASGNNKAFEVDFVLAYPRQRDLDGTSTEEGRYGVGSTNYNILGPNLIEALKLQAIQEQLQGTLQQMGITGVDIKDYFKLNIQFRDKKFHPKLYLTDNVAGIGTQNLTGPVGNSVNQAGSNFETMRFVVNKYKDDRSLNAARLNTRQGRGDTWTEQRDVALKTGDVTQSLLYRQIESISNEELTYSRNDVGRKGGSTATPILSQSRGMQVGFAGDIWQHLKNTLNYAHEKRFDVVGGNTRGGYAKETTTGTSTHMFMVLDQAFMLQLGDTSKNIALAGEMGKEVSSAYGKENFQTQRYYQAQDKLFDLLITGKASVTVDAKNYREQIINPLVQKIEKSGSERLKSNYNKYGRNLGLMAGYSLFNPSTSTSDSSYSTQMGKMMTLLRVQGFTKEAGFSESDLKQIIGMASDNITMAKAPRQHVKSFGLMEYNNKGVDPKLVSYYMGSSNMGQYSMGIEGGTSKQGTPMYIPGDGDRTNTEIGLMLGDRNVSTSLSRASAHQARVAQRYDAYYMDNDPEFTPLNNDFSLDQEEERYELNLAMQHLSTTWNQLGNNEITNPNYNAIRTEPLWQRNINTGGLVILKNRLEQMRKTLGVSESAFKIVDRYGDTSGSGLTSINVSLDLTQALGAKGYLASTSRLPKLQFELSVLNGPNRGSNLFNARTDDGDAGAFVYFVDKSQIVGNGIFANNSGSAISVLGRNNYDDDFKSGLEDGRVDLQSGQSAYMSALDIVPQLFATILGEADSRFGVESQQAKYASITSQTDRRNIATSYMSKMLTGYGDTMNTETGAKVSSMQNFISNISVSRTEDGKEAFNLETEKLIGDISVSLFGQKKLGSSEIDTTLGLHKAFFGLAASGSQEGQEGLVGALRRVAASGDYEERQRIMDGSVAKHLETLALLSPSLASDMMNSVRGNAGEALEVNRFKQFQASLFDSFLQGREGRTYGGQQAVYRTVMMGFAGNRNDKDSVQYLFGEQPRDENGQVISSIKNVGMFARITPLAYRPTTDINAVLYRSIASKSTSMNKYDDALDSVFFAQEARQMGTADNLRVLSSVGIGNMVHANAYFSQDGNGEFARDAEGQMLLKDEQMEMFFRRDSQGNITNKDAAEIAIQHYREGLKNTFQGQDTALQFYTGDAKKVSQLPQRIKNALGARPLYQFGVAAQAVSERSLDGEYSTGDSMSQLTDNYLKRNREKLLKGSDGKMGLQARGEALMKELEAKRKILGDDHIEVIRLARQVTNIGTVSRNAFADSHSSLGAVFSGNTKSVMNQQQMNFLMRTRKDIEDTVGDSVTDEMKEELLRVEVLKASLDLNLGKMLAGSDHMRYSMALIQLGGTYTDTFLANPLYGSVYTSKGAYNRRLANEWHIDDPDLVLERPGQLEPGEGVLARGMREGYIETQQQSIKGSMIGEGGYEVLQKRGDIIVQDPNTNSTVLKRKIDGDWKIVGVADHKGNMSTIKNVVDNTSFSPVGSPTLGTSEMATYRRSGEQSIDYLMDAYHRGGNFDNNEYVGMFHRLRSVMPGSGRRVEGTDSGALIKGVANFAGRNKFMTHIDGERREVEMNTFQHLEQQMYANEVGGSLKAYLDMRKDGVLGATVNEASDYTKLQDGTYGYTPLSSTVHGLYNSNNFKSFFWSHGATIMRSLRTGEDGTKSHFMLDELFGAKGEADIAAAKKVAGALLIQFGGSFITTSASGEALNMKGYFEDRKKGKDISGYNSEPAEARKLQQALIEGLAKGEYGKHYQKLTAALAVQIGMDGSIDKAMAKDKYGRSRSEISSDLLFESLTSKSAFSDISVGGLRGITSTMLSNVLAGDGSQSNELLHAVRSLVDPTAKNAAAYGSINFDSQMDRQATIITTAVDFMHQLSASGSSMRVPGDIDISNPDYRAVMLNVLGAPTDIDDENREMLMQMIEGLSTQITAVSIFSDITFSYSKDPTGTQSVARHEGQHLITPYLGDIKQYKETGQLGKIKHTVASLAAMTSNMKSGLTMYGTQNANQFGSRKARNLVEAESNYLFSSFEKRKFLGFYQGGTTGVYTQDFVDMYTNINKDITEGAYEWKANSITDDGRTKVENFVKAKYGYLTSTDRERHVQRIIEKGGREFAMQQLDDVERGLMAMNDSHQQNASKVIGKTNTKEYLANMSNESMYITLPGISFDQQYGQVVAHIDKSKGMSTIIPSAQIMRNLGAQHADFVDPVVQNYKALTAIFTPGNIANVAFEKVRAGAQTGISIVLTTDETKALQSVMEAAATMEVEIEKAVAGARMQEANAGKVKYQGFTSTGIGSNLMPFGSAAMAVSKQQELGLEVYEERTALLKETTQNMRSMRSSRKYAGSAVERVYIEMGSGLYNSFSSLSKAVETNSNSKHLKEVKDTIYQLHDLRKLGYVAGASGMSKDVQRDNVFTTVTTLQRAYDQLESLVSLPEMAANKEDIRNMQKYLVDSSAELRQYADAELDISKNTPDFWARNDVKSNLTLSALVERGAITEDQESQLLNKVKGKTRRVQSVVHDGERTSTIREVEAQIHKLNYRVEAFDVFEYQEEQTRREFFYEEDDTTKATRKPGETAKIKSIITDDIVEDTTKAYIATVGREREINRTVIKTNTISEATEYSDTYKVVTREVAMEVDGSQMAQTVYDNRRTRDKTEFLNGEVIRDDDLTDVRKIRQFYRRQASALREGIDAAHRDEFKQIKRQSLNITERVVAYESAKGLSQDDRRKGYDTLKSSILKLRNEAAERINYFDKEGIKNRLDPANAFIYHATVMNYDAMLARIELSSINPARQHLSSEQVGYLNRKVARFKEVGMIMNDGTIFEGLGKTSTQLAEHTLFTGKTKAAGTSDYEDPTKSVVNAIKEIGEAFNKSGSSGSRDAVQKKFAEKQINETIQMYKNRMEDMKKFSMTRESQSKLKNKDGTTQVKTDSEQESRITAAHSEYETRTKTIIQRLESLKLDLNEKHMNIGDYEDLFSYVRMEMEDLDRSNLELAEVFRSPTPGGTDPRLHTYRLMEGVHALNRVAQLSGEIQVGQTGIETTKMTSDISRGQTGSWMASLGIVTFGGGDWDGDPYTTVMNRASDYQKYMSEARLEVDKQTALSNSYSKQIAEGASNEDEGKTLQQEYAKSRRKKVQAEAKFKYAQQKLQEQSAAGSRLLTERMRKQVAGYLGMDERFFVEQGEQLRDAITGEERFDDQDKAITGFGGRTMGADELNALMGQGTDIIEGLYGQAGKMMAVNTAMDALLGYQGTDPAEGIEFLHKLKLDPNTNTAKGETAQPNVALVREQISKRLEILEAEVSSGSEKQGQVDFLRALQAEGEDSVTLKAYAGTLSNFANDQDNMLRYVDMLKNVASDDEKRKAGQRAFLGQWIGGEIFNKTQEADTLSKFTSQAVGMDMTEPVFDIVLKTLGKAGGEILGKTYNTIIGSTFQDAPTISSGRAMMDTDSELHQAVRKHYFQDEDSFDISRLSEDRRNEVVDYANKTGVTQAQAAKEIYAEQFNQYQETTRQAVSNAEGTQSFMKNIHQLLRDSIKLKTDGDMMSSLQENSKVYNEKSSQIAAFESGDIADLSKKDRAEYEDLKRQRDSVIDGMASQLGPGPGLKSLMDMDYLINQSTNKGMNLMDYESRFLGGKEVGNSYEFRQINAKLAARDPNYKSIGSRDDISADSHSLMAVARYQTARNVASMVTSYHMDNSNKQSSEIMTSFAASQKLKLASQNKQIHKVSKVALVNRFENGQPMSEDHEMLEYLNKKYLSNLNIEGDKFDIHLDQKSALAQHLKLDLDSAYDDKGVLTSEYQKELTDVARKQGVSVETYLLQFDSVYETTRQQIDPLFGKDGERMENFTLTELMRKNVANAQETGNMPGEEGSHNIRDMAGSELMTTMAQLASQQKLGAQGMGIFSAMYRGVLSELVNANKEVLSVDGKDFTTADKVEQDYILKKVVYKNLVGTEDKGQLWSRATSDETKDWKGFNARMIDEADERFVYQEADESLTVVKDSSEYKGSGKLIRVENDILDAFVEMNERSLTGQQAASAEMMGREALYEYAFNNDEEVDKILRDFLPGDEQITMEGKKMVKDNIQYQAARRNQQVIRQQKMAREMYMDMSDVTKKGSVLNKVGDAGLRAMSKNKVSTGLDVLVPILLTGVGGMISEGNVDDNQLQALGGATVTAFQYARAGSIDDPNPNAYKRKVSGAKALTGVFKFKNALARHGDDNIGMAVAEMAVQEVVSTSFNAVATPWINQKIERNVLGMKAHPSLSAMGMEKYAAGKQLAGNIGASIISAVSSTLISGVFMKTAARMQNGGVKNILDSFAPVANLSASVAERISRQRNQQAAYEEIAAETDGTNSEISDYWVMTDSTYNPDNFAHLADLQEAQDVEPSMDGTIYTDVLA